MAEATFKRRLALLQECLEFDHRLHDRRFTDFHKWCLVREGSAGMIDYKQAVKDLPPTVIQGDQKIDNSTHNNYQLSPSVSVGDKNAE
jgi:hypothetical protein